MFRRILCALALILMFAGVDARAQSMGEQTSAMREVLTLAGDSAAIRQRYGQVIVELQIAFFTREGLETATKASRRFLDEVARTEQDHFAAIEQVNFEVFRDGSLPQGALFSKVFAEMFANDRELMRSYRKKLGELIDAAAARDEARFRSVFAEVAGLDIRGMESAVTLNEAVLATIAEDDPQHGVQRSIVIGAKAIAVMAACVQNAMRGDPACIAPLQDSLRSFADQIAAAIGDSRVSLARFEDELAAGKFELRASDVKMADFLAELVDLYALVHANELAIGDLFRGYADAFEKLGSRDTSAAALETLAELDRSSPLLFGLRGQHAQRLSDLLGLLRQDQL